MKHLKVIFILLIIPILPLNVFAFNGRSGLPRFGVGFGYTFYLSNQMDYGITTNFGSFNEFRSGKVFGFYKPINSKIEVGAFYRNASMMSLKSENTQGIECIFQDLQINSQYSLNDNIDLSKQAYTINLTLGLGMINYQSRYFIVDPIKETEILNFSTVGYGIKDGFSGTKNIPERLNSMTGNYGINFGFRLSENFLFYQENNFNLTSTNKLSGNLYKRSWIPTDGYWYSGIALYIRFGKKADACPRFY